MLLLTLFIPKKILAKHDSSTSIALPSAIPQSWLTFGSKNPFCLCVTSHKLVCNADTDPKN